MQLGKGNLLVFAAKVMAFLIICFAIGRLVEMVMVTQYFAHLHFTAALPALYKSLYVDFASACYGMLLFSIIYFLYQTTKWRFFYYTLQTLVFSILLIYSMVVFGESLLYKEWKTKLNMQALLHFTNPKEVFSTASVGQTIIFFGGTTLLTFILWQVWKRMQITKEFYPNKIWNFITLLPVLAIGGIGLRGGLQPIPVQISDACYSKVTEYNDIAINPLFSLGASIKSYVELEKRNPYACMNNADANKYCAQLFVDSFANTPKWLTVAKPNIVLIALESWSADCCSYGGGDAFAKHLDSFANAGLAFTNCYATGYVSDQGIPGILSGYPATAKTSIINESSKSIKLPCINQDLKTIGYHSAFYFGGQLNYGNIKNYVIQKQYDIVLEQQDLQSKTDMEQRLGICDADMALHFMNALNNATPPFFYNWFTVSSHPPYDVPMTKKQLTTQENDYVNSLVYSDSALGYFMALAKQQPWYKNTLFVFVADHSHNSHKHNDLTTPGRQRIPLVFYGDVIAKAYCGKKINYTVSQLDIAPTLVASVGLTNKTKQYIYSKNLFDASMHYAPFCFYDGAGVLCDSNLLCYRMDNMQTPASAIGTLSNKDTLQVKGFIQHVFEEFRRK
jgi:phosphoglycerol transferase MdoB-like AlkP superfamily enzyme